MRNRSRLSFRKNRLVARSSRFRPCQAPPTSTPIQANRKKPNYSKTLQPTDLPRGTVILAPHVTLNFGRSPHDDTVVFSRIVGDISAKFRPMIVLQTYTYHVVCLPISTFGGHGLAHKPQLIRDDLLEVRGLHLISNHDAWEALPDDPLLVDGGFDSTEVPSFVHVTRPYMLDLQASIKKLGVLTAESLERLMLRYRFAIGKGMRDVGLHPGMMEDVRCVESKVLGDATDAFDYTKALRGGHITKGQSLVPLVVQPSDPRNLFSALTDTCV